MILKPWNIIIGRADEPLVRRQPLRGFRLDSERLVIGRRDRILQRGPSFDIRGSYKRQSSLLLANGFEPPELVRGLVHFYLSQLAKRRIGIAFFGIEPPSRPSLLHVSS